MSDDKIAVAERWALDINDSTVFVQYRGVDVAAVWLPFDDPDTTPTISIAGVDQFREWIIDPQPGEVYTEWCVGGETVVGLGDHIQVIDKALEATARQNRYSEARRKLVEMTMKSSSLSNWKQAVEEYLEAEELK